VDVSSARTGTSPSSKPLSGTTLLQTSNFSREAGSLYFHWKLPEFYKLVPVAKHVLNVLLVCGCLSPLLPVEVSGLRAHTYVELKRIERERGNLIF
jgi:hypothetical protein